MADRYWVNDSTDGLWNNDTFTVYVNAGSGTSKSITAENAQLILNRLD